MIRIISYTEAGTKLNRELQKLLGESESVSYAPERYAEGISVLPKDTKEWIGSLWGTDDFIFIGATGIAIRMIAPWIRDKFTDSAVISLDERGQFVIPLLSGHVGGAVELSEKIAAYLRATPVVTTATDVQGKFAVDVFAKKHDLVITSREKAKLISAAILRGETVGVYTDLPAYEDTVKMLSDSEGELVRCRSIDELNGMKQSIVITGRVPKDEDSLSDASLILLSKNIVAGVGCRKGKEAEELRGFLGDVLRENGMIKEQIKAITSIDLKAEEPGLLAISEEWRVPFIVYSAEELSEIEAVSARSEFVASITGIDNVCERAALNYMKEHGGGELILEKTCKNGMTLALGELK